MIDVDLFLECVGDCGTLVRRDVPNRLCAACTNLEREFLAQWASEGDGAAAKLASARRRQRVDAALTLACVVVVLVLFGTPFVLGCRGIWAALWQ